MKRNNLNIKLLNTNQKELNEALFNYNLTIIDDEDSVLVNNNAYKHSSIYNDLIDRNISEFLDNDEIFKDTIEKMLLIGRQYTVKDKNELRIIIIKSAEIFGNECNLNWVDTSQITDMSYLFYLMENFNGHIENWDTHNVKSMKYMFDGTKSFNQPIGDWDISNVEDMQRMFCGALTFN